jgi:murein DD-endopeptidase MepM/ murein hydrolase activator NlpD
LIEKKPKPDKQEYTIMIVPHQGKLIRSFSMNDKVIKCGIAILCAGALLLGGSYVNFNMKLKVAQAEKVELEQYRLNNGSQQAQLEQLVQDTAVLQEELNRLNKLEAELRGIVKNEQATGTSRSGIERPSPANQGQGGPVAKPTVQELTALVQQMKATAKAKEENLSELKAELVAIQAQQAITPSIWPAQGDVTSRFGWRQSPIGWGRDWHPGLDIANSYGTPIVATADGEVVESGWNGGYGKMIRIDHGNGIATVYGHNSSNLVDVGAYVKKGDVIAYMGSTGYSTGPHVHYEVRVNGNAVNPASFL